MILPALPLLSRIQLWETVVESAKVRPDNVCEPFMWTVFSAVMLSVLKFAVNPEPSATIEPVQLAAVFQSPPQVALVHVPLAAWA